MLIHQEFLLNNFLQKLLKSLSFHVLCHYCFIKTVVQKEISFFYKNIKCDLSNNWKFHQEYEFSIRIKKCINPKELYRYLKFFKCFTDF